MSAQTDLYDSLLADVVTLTNRPDLSAEAAVAIKTATLSIHARAAFPRDVGTVLAKQVNATFITSLDAITLFPRLRGLSTVRLCDVNYNPLESPEIEIIELGDIYDPEYKTLKNNVAYIAGTNVNVRSGVAAYGYLVEYLASPLVLRAQYNSWIAQLAPDAILYTACSIVYATSGNEEKAAAYQKLVDTRFFPELVQNYLTSAIR